MGGENINAIMTLWQHVPFKMFSTPLLCAHLTIVITVNPVYESRACKLMKLTLC